MTTTGQPLDAYESALLTELRSHVTGRTATTRKPKQRRRAAIAAIAASVAAVATTITAVASWPQAAYAVDTEADGDIAVTMRSLEDTRGLEEALADAGVDASVTYAPGTPQPPADSPGAGLNISGDGTDGRPRSGPETDEVLEPDDRPDGDGCRTAVSLRQDNGQVEFTISANAAESDATLHITASGGTDDHWTSMAVRWSEPPC